VGTTAELAIEVGELSPATEIPLVAASVRGSKATVFVVQGQTARKGVYAVKGERDGRLFLDPALAAGGRVVTEGRGLLKDGDRVEATLGPTTTEPIAAEPAGGRI
jgi:hypothetical protein